MIGHLGTRVSALLDGQLPAAEADRAWAHVHLCHVCRDAVEREGWVKTRLAGLGGTTPAPSHLKGSLMFGDVPALPQPSLHQAPARRPGLVVLSGSAAGVAVLGVLVLGLVSGPDSTSERRTPVTNLSGSDSPGPVPVRAPVPERREILPTPAR